MLTYGFYNSRNHDRRYDALQISSMFDGIIHDGVYMGIGNRLMVTQGTGMMVLVGTGRAWFNHTWTLNDAPLPITIPQSEVILNRIDAVVLEVNNETSVRANSVKVVKGTPSSNPVRPTLINNVNVHQHPLAYVHVTKGVTSIRTADITNMVGTSACPFVTGVVQSMNIDPLIAKWEDQWNAFFERETADMTATNAFWKDQWQKWFIAQTAEIQNAYLNWKREWDAWYDSQTTEMINTKNYWEELWEAWFYQYTNDNIKDIADFKVNLRKEFDEWFAEMNAIIDGDIATNLANELIEVKRELENCKKFKHDLLVDHSIYDVLYDNSYRHYEEVLDNVGDTVLDSDSSPVISGTYMSEPILDSDGHAIEARIKFALA